MSGWPCGSGSQTKTHGEPDRYQSRIDIEVAATMADRHLLCALVAIMCYDPAAETLHLLESAWRQDRRPRKFQQV